MKPFDIPSEGAQMVVGEIRDQFLGPFIAATRVALGEMTGIEVSVGNVYQKALQHALGDVAAVLGLQSSKEKLLVLGFPRQTATALAGRMLTGAAAEVEENLIPDCVGEIANVVAGQAKAMLAGSPYRFSFSLPEIVTGPKGLQTEPFVDCLVVTFSSDHGEFFLQLFVTR